MKQSQNNPATEFLKTDKNKTKSNAIEVPSISLPKGGGAIKGIDEKFTVNAVNGTAAFSIPLPFSPARGASPALSLSYSSGAGNGIFGLGWDLNLASVKRKTDNGLPQYIDATESDTFLFSEVEDLVPGFKKENDGSFSIDIRGDYIINEKDSPDGLCKIRFYKPRIEGLFARIERWTNKETGVIKWRIITKENVVTLFGWSNNSIIADPKENNKIIKWLPEFVFDDKGNCANYIYKKDDDKGFNPSLPHNKNRFQNGSITYANLYLEKILYGNKTPYKKFGNVFPLEADYMFQTVFDYGEYNLHSPYTKIKDWDFRLDAFSDYKAGFEIRTTRLCKRVLLFHYFNELPGGSALIKSINFEYVAPDKAGITFLQSVTGYGYIKKDDGSYTFKTLPATEFKYQEPEWNTDVKTIASEDLVHAPSGLDEQQYLFTDLYNEGLSGILTEQATGWFYKHNLGEGKFENAKLISPKPSFTGLGKQLLLTDLDADGGKQLVNLSSQPTGYFELDDDDQWQPFINFKTLPNIDLKDRYTRMIDLNGDGKPEILITENDVFTWYKSEGRKGFSQGAGTLKTFNEEAGPHIIFADQQQSIFLADMSGDGMIDIVRIRNGQVNYWPNLGYGKFGAKVEMDNAPLFGHPDSFNPALIRLADIDGSGTTDLIYLGKNKFTCWFNLSGNTFSSSPFETVAFPPIDNKVKITVTDLLGNGVACIVWSGNLSKDSGSSLQYIDLMNSKKPHIMVFYKNNLGKEVTLEYAPSTKFYLADKLAGRPWATKLHFPVHCINKTETTDKISGWKFTTSYKYHHGYYDHSEREFRGFGMVEQTDSEHFEHWEKGEAANIEDKELQQQPVVSKTWFHTGAFLAREKILHHFAGEYWQEEMRKLGFAVINHEVGLPDAGIIPGPGISASQIEHLSVDEWRQALRACKSMLLRTEVFAYDAPATGASEEDIKRQLTPYSVAAKNCAIELLQPKGKNEHAIFVVKNSETITYTYERNTADPRIAHQLNLSFDEYGNVLESAAVVYPRILPDAALPLETREEQSKIYITCIKNRFTNDVINDDVHRLRLPSEVQTFELKEIAKNAPFFAVKDFDNILTTANEVAYNKINSDPVTGSAQKRLIEHIRTNYYRNDLSGPLPLHQLESLALPFESYQLAYTPELIADIYGAKVTDALMIEGKFTNSEGDNNWWIRSGTTQFTEGIETFTNAQNRFYVPVGYTDPYQTSTKVKYYSNYFLFIEETEDALGNKEKVDLFNFRTLSAQRMRDINNNLSETFVDELGFVKAMAVMGKDSDNDGVGEDADDLTGITTISEDPEIALIHSFFNAPDSVQLVIAGKNLLQRATTYFAYDLDAYKNTGKPPVVAVITREAHFQKNNDSPIQLSFEYSNGMGKLVMKKVQAEPGLAKKAIINPDNTYTITEVDTAALNPKQLRWIGNGRTILNNKGNAVKQYEPYFSVTHHYEDQKELVETGITPILHYDALSRLVKTVMPDETLSRIEFDSWKQMVYDANDTILTSPWHHNRINNLIDAELLAAGKDPDREKAAAEKAAEHADTPNALHLDSLGRPVLFIAQNKNSLRGADEFHRTKLELDIEGNLRSVTDARELPENRNKGNEVIRYKYDMLGNLVYQQSMDAGQRWLLTNILGNPLRTWDERNHEFQYFYDALHRPAQSKVVGGDGASALNNIFDRIFHGESLLLPDRSNEAALQAINILGKPVKHFDTAGVVLTPEYDFKGQPASTTRKLYKNYKSVADWINANLINDLEEADFTFVNEIDALGRITKQTAPDGSIIMPSYNQAGLLNGETVQHPDPAVITTYIKDIDYNEKGQRNKIIYGNDVTTKYYYDKETFRIKRLQSNRQNGDALQDWYYTFDPIGNITHIEDKNIPVVFFDNQKITGVSEYTYDALYRLVKASGRENNAALNFGDCDNWNDKPFVHQMNPGDPMAARNYIQTYEYDQVGNILKMKHVAQNNNWTRTYAYEAANNRLKSTHIGDNSSPVDYIKYRHHPTHGFLEELPHLETIRWNFKEEVALTTRQHCTEDAIPVITYYQYDSLGQRIRKITENSGNAGANPTKKEERIYASGYELYIKHSGSHTGLQRKSLSLLDEGHRFVMIETRNEVNDGTEKHIVRYQLHNHAGSAGLEIDGTAVVISYEEFHPFGTTAYLANNATVKAVARRYRYIGMERDEENGLEYHSARYYLPWLGRWLSADPIGIGDGINHYVYVNNDPVNYTDVDGKQSMRVSELQLQNLPDGTVQQLIVAGGGVPGPCYTNPTYQQRQADIATLRNILIRAHIYDSYAPVVAPTVRYVEDHTPVLMADSRGNGYIGPRYIVERQIQGANFGYQLEVGDNIRGGIFGAIGYAVGGDRGSYVGAAVDGVAMAAAPLAGARATRPSSPSRATAAASAPPPARPARPAARPVRPAAPPAAPPPPPAPPAGTTETPRDTGPYSAQRMRQGLTERYGSGSVSSTTVPNPAHRSLRRAAVDVGGGRSVGFDERGLPDFSPFAVTTARVPRGEYRGEMRAATRQVRAALQRGESLGVTFTPEQQAAINAGDSTIPGYRWHHVSGGELQLIPAEIHNAVSHIGSGAMRHGR